MYRFYYSIFAWHHCIGLARILDWGRGGQTTSHQKLSNEELFVDKDVEVTFLCGSLLGYCFCCWPQVLENIICCAVWKRPPEFQHIGGGIKAPTSLIFAYLSAVSLPVIADFCFVIQGSCETLIALASSWSP